MFPTELDSFVRKFHQLWSHGITAHLDLDTHAGSAWVGLRVHLGHVPGPPHGPVYPSPHKHVPPSRQRRRARPEAERKKKSEEADKGAPIVEETTVAEDIEKVEADKGAPIVEETIFAEDIEKASTDAKKNCSDKTDDIALNVTEEVANKGFDSCVVDEVCPDEEFNAASAVEELEGEEEITVEFLSDYAEEDINDTLKELSEKGFVPSLPILISRKRVTKRGAEHFCNVQLKIPSSERKSFLWPSLKDCPEFFKNVKML